MKAFRAVAVLRRPRDQLWRVVRDQLPHLTEQIADIDRIVVVDRTVDADGKVHLTNRWHVRQQLPALVRSVLDNSDLGWTDRNLWDEATWTCDWTIEPFIFKDYIQCSGKTCFEPAMAGQGTRVTFEGVIDLKSGLLSGSMASLERPVLSAVESVVTTVVPRNLQRVFEVAAAYRD